MDYENEHEAMLDMATELIAWMREHQDLASYEMVESVNETFNLGLDDDLRRLIDEADLD